MANGAGFDKKLIAMFGVVGFPLPCVPISRVRSVTDTSMVFMMLMPPTQSEIDATAAAAS